MYFQIWCDELGNIKLVCLNGFSINERSIMVTIAFTVAPGPHAIETNIVWTPPITTEGECGLLRKIFLNNGNLLLGQAIGIVIVADIPVINPGDLTSNPISHCCFCGCCNRISYGPT